LGGLKVGAENARGIYRVWYENVCLYVWLCVVLLYVEVVTRVYSGIVDWGEGGGDRSGM
jgi:hypothetical protein